MTHELVIDNFAGGGGASVGIEQALGRPVDYAVNHDEEAIAMHKANHPQTIHMCQSIHSIDPYDVAQRRPVALIWFSPDCTHHSKARGGLPKKKNIRDLAWVVPHWIERLEKTGSKPRVIMLENVEEFRDWGPLIQDINGDWRACPNRRGETFRAFVATIERMGYVVEFKEQVACDFGAGTTRKRLFMIARCDGKPIVWPEATHGPGTALPFVSAADNIDFSLPCPSIFERKRPLVDATLRRIATGIVRYVLNDPHPFIVPITNRNGGPAPRSTRRPLPTMTTSPGGEFALASPTLIQVAHGDSGSRRAYRGDEPLRTISAVNGHALMMPTMERMDHSEDVAAFMAQHNTGMVGRRADKPLSTIVGTGTQQQLVTSNLIKLRGSTDSHIRASAKSVEDPLDTICAKGLHHAEIRAFLVKYYGDGGQWQSLHDPIHTIPTVARFGLVTTYIDGDLYALSDIGMRMLEARELFNAQGFPHDYIIDPIGPSGRRLSKRSQAAKCGNSVSPVHPKAMVEANLPELCQLQRAVA